jgi:hypothetical protein
MRRDILAKGFRMVKVKPVVCKLRYPTPEVVSTDTVTNGWAIAIAVSIVVIGFAAVWL